jgi:sodium-dependent dicarboxylate transporter 2/3/5
VSIDTAPAVSELNNIGGLKAPEREILLVLLASALLWTTGSMLESAMNLPPTALSSAVVAIVAVAFLSVEEIVNWDDLRSVNWGVYFVIGAGLSLGDALAKTGASAWFASLLAPILQGLPYSLVVTLLVLVGFALTQLINNVPLGAVLAPVLITLGQASGTAPERLVLPAIMALAPAYMLPGASARMTLLAVTSAVTRPQMMRTGLLVGLPSALVILAYFLVLAWLGLI